MRQGPAAARFRMTRSIRKWIRDKILAWPRSTITWEAVRAEVQKKYPEAEAKRQTLAKYEEIQDAFQATKRRLLMEPPKSDAVASQEALAELHQRDGPAPAQRQAQLPAQFQDDQVLADLKVQPREHVHHWQGPGERRMRPAGVEHPGLAYPA